MSNQCLVLLCGLPACGKTTLAKKLIQRGEVDVDYICFDELMENEFTPKEWKQKRKTMWETANELITKNNKSDKKRVILLDDNFYYSSMRHEYFQLARKYEISYCQIFLTCPLKICIERNAKRKEKVSEKVLIEMSSKLEMPDEAEQKQVLNLCIDSSEKSVEQMCDIVMEFIMKAFDKPLKNVVEMRRQMSEKDREITLKNVVHQTDILLRKRAGELIKSVKSDKSKVALQLGEIRKQALKSLRNNTDLDAESIILDAKRKMEQLILQSKVV